MANNKIKGLTVEIGGDATKLGKALQEIENKSKSLSGELGQVNRLLKVDPENTDLIAQKQQILSEAVANTAKKLETLKAAEKQVQAQFERGDVSAEQVRELRREIIATEQKLGGYERAAQETADAIEQLGGGADGISDIGKKASAAARRVGDLSDAAKDAGEGLGTAGVATGAFVGNLASEAFGKIVDGLKECIEVTQEYQTAMGKLDTAFTTNGYSSEAALKTYKELQGILGETDQAVEAANHLAILTDNEADLQTWTDICTGVFATFGDSLPIEGLTEAANETAKVGQVTGPLADALNWAGVSEDKFNESLAACTDEQERQQLIMDTLNGLYSEASDAYKETNADVIAANKANEEWTASMAAVGAEFTPLVAEVKAMGAELLDKAVPAIQWVKDNLPTVAAMIATVTAGITAFKVAQLAAIASEQGMTLAQYAATQAKTAATSAQNGLNAAMKANPIGFVITAISLLVTAFMYLWNNCESFRLFWQNLWEGAKSTFQSVWTWLSNFFTVTIPDIFNTVISFIETNWQGLLLLLVNPFAGAFKLIYDNCEGFRTKVNEVVSAVLNTLRELPAQVLSVGRNLVEGLWNGINDKLLWLKDKIKSFTESVLDSIKHFFGVNSPSKKTAWTGSSAPSRPCRSIWTETLWSAPLRSVWMRRSAIFTGKMKGGRFMEFDCKIGGVKYAGLELLDAQIGLPIVKTKQESVPGADGVIDLTDVLNGGPAYGNRSIKLRFGFDPYGSFDFYAFAGAVHGKRLKLELGNRSGYYMGRFTVGDIDKSKTTTMFDVTIDADPYRLESAETSISIPCLARTSNTMIDGAATVHKAWATGVAQVYGTGADTVLSVYSNKPYTGEYRQGAIFKLPWPEAGSCLVSADVENGWYGVCDENGTEYTASESRWIETVPANGLYIMLFTYGGAAHYGKLRNIQVFKATPASLAGLASDRMLYPTVTWTGDVTTIVPCRRPLPLATLRGNEKTSPYLQIQRRAADYAYAIGDTAGTVSLTGRRGWL